MHYKTIILELLQQRPQMHEQLRKDRKLLPALELYATELKTSHETWKDWLQLLRPDSESSQIASEAMEMALQDLEESLPTEPQNNDHEPLSLDAAMAFIRRPTPRA